MVCYRIVLGLDFRATLPRNILDYYLSVPHFPEREYTILEMVDYGASRGCEACKRRRKKVAVLWCADVRSCAQIYTFVHLCAYLGQVRTGALTHV